MGEPNVWVVVVNILLATLLSLGGAPILVWMERRVAGLIQDRFGPNRCHIGGIRLFGLVQSVADMLKLAFKEDFHPSHIKQNLIYTLAPAFVFVCAFLTFMVMPLADVLVLDGNRYLMQALPIEFGLLWFLAFAGLSVYGILLGGWASDNKYSLLGSLRASAQVVSYEAAMGLSLVSMLIVYGSVHLSEIAAFQGKLLFGVIPAWGVVLQPLAALIFIITAFAETNRAPFDMAEGESEIVGGFHTEYAAMRFGLFFVGEYIAMCASSAIIVTLFFGGYQIPWASTAFLKGHISEVLGVIMVVLPVLCGLFIGWMRRQNRWIDPLDPRAKETFYLTRVFIGMTVVLELGLAWMVLGGLGENGTSISVAALQVLTFAMKVYAMNFVYIWVRWTLPRFRYDHLQMLSWKVLLPLALANVVITALVVVGMGW
ncbi:NADH-quinone oxidoreductase subunit H [Sulfurospirillum sp. T05]|uniref:NADH-quinone oxidoreductase subunit H n=1 Tax=Sulfurospirillum tamanense TaxID=2813362 RepID=A0ABS2WPE3_9BACT|nr:NADH-quinone oxidoreductase subunit H [Sulfurospirillum tamanensis]MBN2963514.1 NADH-quinone oxidoreductase subunit H [Sulfurospirillum tamanensis]